MTPDSPLAIALRLADTAGDLLVTLGTAPDLRAPLAHLRTLVGDIESGLSVGDHDTTARSAIEIRRCARALETIGAPPELITETYALIRALRTAEPVDTQINRLLRWRDRARIRVCGLALAGRHTSAAFEHLAHIETDLNRAFRRRRALDRLGATRAP